MGAYTLEQACREAARWQFVSTSPIQVAVNVSAIHFNAESIVQEIREILVRTGLRPGLLQVELTESVLTGSLQR
jgi:EAL domain-containing protein (putative c-di-GMP-specific phosphodiesterase class I)